MNSRRGITVPNVIRSMGIEPENRLCWAIGNDVRDLYMARNNGALPPKDLHEKTSGGGSHTFATYDESYRVDIERIVRRHLEYRKWQKIREPDLFAQTPVKAESEPEEKPPDDP